MIIDQKALVEFMKLANGRLLYKGIKLKAIKSHNAVKVWLETTGSHTYKTRLGHWSPFIDLFPFKITETGEIIECNKGNLDCSKGTKWL